MLRAFEINDITRLKRKSGAIALIAIGVILASLSGGAHAESTLEKVRQTRHITLAFRESSFPFSYLDKNNKPAGYSIDLCNAMVEGVRKTLNVPVIDVTYFSVTPGTRMNVIETGKADLECGSTSDTMERREHVQFTLSHFITGSRMIVRTHSGIKDWPDLRDKRVVTTSGTTSLKLLEDRSDADSLHLKVLQGKDHAESFAMVVDGKADAFVMDDVLLYGLRASAKDPEAFTVEGSPLSAEPYGMMLRKNDPDFKKLLDRLMAQLMTSGQMESLYNKWFTSPIPDKNNVNMQMPMSFLLHDSMRFPTDLVGK